MTRRQSSPRRSAHPPGSPRGRRGFTLIELGVVVIIIGLLVSLILVASAEGLQRAQERQTQSTLIKVNQGLTERLDALLSQVPEANGAHEFLAATFPAPPSQPPQTLPTGNPNPVYYWGLSSASRAHVIARLDYLKAEMPDVFVLNDLTTPEGQQYPFNFAALPYPPGSSARANYVLPLGHLVSPGYHAGDSDSTGVPVNYGPGASYVVNPKSAPAAWQALNPTAANSTGIYGASYSARGAFHKLLGLPAQSFDGVDNDYNGWVDELTPSETGWSQPQLDEVLLKLGNHTHETARAECLYALLVGGIGPLGSVFSPDDFGPNEVADTDGDGLPELIDAWGEPFQFYRWPVHYASPLQRGPDAYLTVAEPRETSTNDPNNLLLSPAWWLAGFNAGAPAFADPTVGTTSLYPYGGSNASTNPYDAMSGHAAAVMWYFGSLAEALPYQATLPLPGAQAANNLWDRSGFSMRRAYATRPLVVSSGPDRLLGIARLGGRSANEQDYVDATGTMITYPAVAPSPARLTMIENTASPFSPMRNETGPPYFAPAGRVDGGTVPNNVPPDAHYLAAQDDISNQNIQAAGGGIR